MLIRITRRWDGTTLHELESTNLRSALVELVGRGADLRDADLGGAVARTSVARTSVARTSVARTSVNAICAASAMTYGRCCPAHQ